MSVGGHSAESLLEMARGRSSERRGELALALVDLFRDGDNVLTDRDRALMTGILQGLLREIEVEIRRALAERVAHWADAPHALVRDLALDSAEVAWPVLVQSGVLEQDDLVELVYQRSMEHRLAIAQRGNLSEAVADALIQAGDDNVIVTLLRNADARLSGAAMEYLVDQSERIDAFQEPLLRRSELTPDLARRMFLWVSAALRQDIIGRFHLDPQTVDDLMEQVVARDGAQDPPGKDRLLIAEMERTGVMGPDLLLPAVRMGDSRLFGRVVEHLLGIRPLLATRMLFEAAGEGLGVLGRAAGLPAAAFIEIYTLARKARPFDAHRLERDRQRLTDFYASLTKDAALAVVGRWRRNPDYLAALREVEKARTVNG